MNAENHRDADGKEIALEPRHADGAKLASPSAARNKDIVLGAFQKYMPTSGMILEIAAGTGEHGAHIVKALPEITWLPADIDERSRESISAYGDEIEDGRLKFPVRLDVSAHNWWASEDIIGKVAGVVCINMIHITPFECAEGLFRGADAILKPGERLFLYGPFSRSGEMAESNRAFDADLKSRDPRWGVRDLDDEIIPLATKHAFHLAASEDVPANNMVVVFEKS